MNPLPAVNSQSALAEYGLHATVEIDKEILRPLLLELRDEKCAHTWQPLLKASNSSDIIDKYLEIVGNERSCQIFTYIRGSGLNREAVAIASLSPRISSDASLDGIAILGRTYVRKKYRGKSIYGAVLDHRLCLCSEIWGNDLYGVHLGTSSKRVEDVFRKSFKGSVIKLGIEDLGNAGLVGAFLGITKTFETDVTRPIHRFSKEQRAVNTYLLHNREPSDLSRIKEYLDRLRNHSTAYLLSHELLKGMPSLNVGGS